VGITRRGTFQFANSAVIQEGSRDALAAFSRFPPRESALAVTSIRSAPPGLLDARFYLGCGVSKKLSESPARSLAWIEVQKPVNPKSEVSRFACA